jgi:hypothetical protein
LLAELLALSPSLFVVVGLTRVHGERRFFLAKRSLRLELFCQHQQQNIPHASEICQERAAERRRDSGLRSLPERCTLIQFSTCLGDLSPLLLLLVQREIRKLFPQPRALKRCISGRIIPQIDINLKKLSAWRSRPCVSWLFI